MMDNKEEILYFDFELKPVKESNSLIPAVLKERGMGYPVNGSEVLAPSRSSVLDSFHDAVKKEFDQSFPEIRFESENYSPCISRNDDRNLGGALYDHCKILSMRDGKDSDFDCCLDIVANRYYRGTDSKDVYRVSGLMTESQLNKLFTMVHESEAFKDFTLEKRSNFRNNDADLLLVKFKEKQRSSEKMSGEAVEVDTSELFDKTQTRSNERGSC